MKNKIKIENPAGDVIIDDYVKQYKYNLESVKYMLGHVTCSQDNY